MLRAIVSVCVLTVGIVGCDGGEASKAAEEGRSLSAMGAGYLRSVVEGDGEFARLVAQQRAIQSRSALASVRYLRLDNRVALHLALGGDFKTR